MTLTVCAFPARSLGICYLIEINVGICFGDTEVLQVHGNEEFFPFSRVFCGDYSPLVGSVGSRNTQNHSKFPPKSLFF